MVKLVSNPVTCSSHESEKSVSYKSISSILWRIQGLYEKILKWAKEEKITLNQSLDELSWIFCSVSEAQLSQILNDLAHKDRKRWSTFKWEKKFWITPVDVMNLPKSVGTVPKLKKDWRMIRLETPPIIARELKVLNIYWITSENIARILCTLH